MTSFTYTSESCQVLRISGTCLPFRSTQSRDIPFSVILLYTGRERYYYEYKRVHTTKFFYQCDNCLKDISRHSRDKGEVLTSVSTLMTPYRLYNGTLTTVIQCFSIRQRWNKWLYQHDLDGGIVQSNGTPEVPTLLWFWCNSHSENQVLELET